MEHEPAWRQAHGKQKGEQSLVHIIWKVLGRLGPWAGGMEKVPMDGARGMVWAAVRGVMYSTQLGRWRRTYSWKASPPKLGLGFAS